MEKLIKRDGDCVIGFFVRDGKDFVGKHIVFHDFEYILAKTYPPPLSKYADSKDSDSLKIKKYEIYDESGKPIGKIDAIYGQYTTTLFFSNKKINLQLHDEARKLGYEWLDKF
jgi:hypothetical protein